MIILDSNIITEITVNLNANITIHPSSIEYIRQLVQPDTYQPEMSLIYKIIAAAHKGVVHPKLEKYINLINLDLSLTNLYDSFIKLIISQIIQLAIHYVVNICDSIILPWDIITIINNNKLVILLDTAENLSSLLPVKIIVGPQEFEHMLNEEFTCGLLLASETIKNKLEKRNIIPRSNFIVEMFDRAINSDYMCSYNRFLAKQYKYSVTINNFIYNFNTAIFMKGFVTGIQWMGLDHRLFWCDLLDRSEIPQGIQLTF